MQADFDATYAAGYRSVLRAVVLLTPTVEDAHDIASEAWARAYDRWAQVGELDAPVAWVRRVAVNPAVDARRREGSRWRAYRRWGARAEPVAATDGASVDVIRALATLKPAHRRAVVLHYLCDLPVAQIAAYSRLPEDRQDAPFARPDGPRRRAAHPRRGDPRCLTACTPCSTPKPTGGWPARLCLPCRR